LTDALITIAVPSYNQGRYLDATLASIFQQDIPVEVFVMDGGSNDNSLTIIKKWESKLAGWYSHPDKGQAAAINKGIEQGSAPYVCWLNSDDFYYPNGLKSIFNCLNNHPGNQFAYGKCWTVSAGGKRIFPYLTLPFTPWLFANFCSIAQPATLIKRNAWKQIGGLDQDMQMAFDYDLWWRLFEVFKKPIYCKEFVAATRMHKDTKTANKTELHYQESIEVLKRQGKSVPLKWHVTLPLMKTFNKLNKWQLKARK